MQLGMGEMIFIFLLALIIFGPKKLPEIGRQLGKAMNEFKRASNEFRSQLEDEIRQIDVAEQNKAQAKQLAAATESPAESNESAERAMAGELTIAPPPEAIAQGMLPSDTNRLSLPQNDDSPQERIAAAASSHGNASEIAPPAASLTQEFNG